MSNPLDEYRTRLRESVTIINDLKAKLVAAERANNDPIAVVGMACRFPGGCSSTEAYWEGLVRGVDGVVEVPAERWPASDIDDAGNEVRWAALIDSIDAFDAGFFGISPREAATLDPQQRLLLELTWEAVEDAGILPEAILGSRTGVYVGICTNDYWHGIIRHGAVAIDAYGATGNLFSTAAGRISYWLGAKGPAASIDTACSSSLVALDFAAQALRNGQCDQALVGGVNAILSPFSMAMMLRLGALSPDGRCKTFDARANGYVRGEGCGVIVLKRLADARKDGDRIRALLLGSMVNQDGRSTGLTTPNVLSQQMLLRQTLEKARVSAEDITYVETHGTGTPLGDPIEFDALKAVIGQPRRNGSSCALGAVKTNIGHLEGAAGIAGIIKAVLCLEHEAIPKNLHQRALNPRIDLEGTPFFIPRELTPWRRGDKPRRAGISSFGISGTNAHVILEEAPGPPSVVQTRETTSYFLPLSAKSPAALRALAASYAEWFVRGSDCSLADIAYTASVRRTHHEHRVAVIASTHAEFADILGAFARSAAPGGVVHGKTSASGTQRLVFVFSGQGSQWAGMGKTLLDEEPVFRAKVEQIDALVRLHANFSVLEELRKPEETSRLGETEIVQPALFAVQVGLVELFKSWGIVPQAVLGHSVGEVAAAHASGAILLEDAVRLVVLRGRIMQKATGGGKMVWVALPESYAEEAIAKFNDRLAIAAINDPTSVVLSGETTALDAVVARLEKQGVATRPLRVNYAFHSPQMEPLASDLALTLGQIPTYPSSIRLYSTVIGTRIDHLALAPKYWARNVRETVNLARAVNAALDDGHQLLIEIGPHPVLLANLEQCAVTRNQDVRTIATLRRHQDGRHAMLDALGALYTQGFEIDWKKFAPSPGRVVPLPTYPWQRKRYWIETPALAPSMGKPTGHPLLGNALTIASVQAVFESVLDPNALTWLHEHRVFGEIIVPGAALLEMARAAGAVHLGAEHCQVLGFAIQAPLRIAEKSCQRVQVLLKNTEHGDLGVRIYSQSQETHENHSWVLHAQGTVRSVRAQTTPNVDLRALLEREHTTLDVTRVYESFARLGLDFGPGFQGIRQLRRIAHEVVAEVELADPLATNASKYMVHPALLDAGLQCLMAVDESTDSTTYLPFEFGEATFFGPAPLRAWVHARLDAASSNAESITGSVSWMDETGRLFASVSNLRAKRANAETMHHAISSDASNQDFYRIDWSSRPLPESSSWPTGEWLIVCDSSAVIAPLEQHLAAAGALSHRTSFDALPERLSAFSAANTKLAGIVCWWEQTPGDAIPRLAGKLVTTALLAVQSLLRAGVATKLFFVTHRGMALGADDTLDIAQSPLWGFGRVVRNELPDLNCKLIDLDEAATESCWREFAASDDEPEVMWRHDKRFVPRLVKANSIREKGVVPRRTMADNATVLVTGGLGALGMRVARWLWEQHHVAHILLVSRHAPTPDKIADLERLRAQGASITVAAVDVSNASAVQDMVKSIPPEYPLRGIIHAAGVLDDGLISDQHAERFASVFAPKVYGAWNLHDATRNVPLDFFVLFSSIASVLGSAGQGNYAAANAFLDALAHARHTEGLPAQSLHWGPWSEAGMAAELSETLQSRLSRMGMGMLSPARGLSLLDAALKRPEAELVAMSLDVQALGRNLGQEVPPIWRSLVATKVRAGAARTPAGAWLEHLSRLPQQARDAEVTARIGEDIAKVLSFTSAHDIPKDRPLQELGLDSLMAVEVRNAIAARVGQPLPATLVFDHPTLNAIVRYLMNRVVRQDPPLTTTVASKGNTSSGTEPIAIIGMGCRYPGGIRDADTFWKLLAHGEDAIRVIPRERWNVDALYDDDPAAPGKMYTREAGMLETIEWFDAAFFGISAREAIWMDPQQRLLLETTWEALEHAGFTAEKLIGSDTGVFVGLMYHEYASLGSNMLAALEGHAGTGSAGSVASGRISYTFGLQGPSLTIDTACSSSLVTLHLACRSLRAHECSIALAGGVALMLTPTTHVEFSRLRALARDGRCKSFDAAADGVAWSEGCGMLVLKRLSDAQRDGDSILAVVRGSAVNQDGRSNGLTAPNGPSQEAVIRRALNDAGLTPSDIDYVEGHGTGTPLGDPIEIQALGAVYGESRTTNHPLLLGSVKSNIGHSQSAAGAAGIMKVVLSLQHQVIPRSLHFHEPNPRIDWSRFSLKVVSEAMPWMSRTEPRRAGVSSFGISGTNAHVIVEEAPRPAPIERKRDASAYLLPLSAKSPEAMRALAASYAEWFARGSDSSLADIVFTMSVRRTHHEHRLAAVAGTHEEFAEKLAAFARGDTPSGVVQGKAPASNTQRLVFVFSGQGSQWPGMGKNLLDTESVFRAKVEQIDRLVRRYAEFSVLEALRASEETSRLGETEIVQPALFALQVGVVELLASWGIVPHAVMGHSVGEVAAAHVSGAISLEEAVRLVVLRGRIMQKATGLGKMVWVALPRALAEQEILGLEDKLAIAAINDPSSVVLSGETKALEALVALLDKRGIATRPLRVNYAFHSPQMDALASEFATLLGSCASQTPQTTLYSTVTGGRIEGGTLGPEYWARNVRETVDLAQAINTALDDGHSMLVEIGPHPVLVANLEQCAAEKNVDARVVPTLRRQDNAFRSLLQTVGALHTAGLGIAWHKLLPEGGRVISLPTYAWQRERYWIPLPDVQVQTPSGTVADNDAVAALSADKFADCMFHVEWQRADLPAKDAATKTKPQHWLIFKDGQGLGTALAKQLRAKGERVTEVIAAAEHRRLGDELYQLDPTNLVHWEQLLAFVFEKEECHGVFHCAALDIATWPETTVATLGVDLRRGPLATIRLAQALMKQGWRDTPRLYVVTRAAQAVGTKSAAVSVGQSTLWGLGRVMAMEVPDLGCIRIDLPPESDPNEATFILRELAESGAENQIALRAGERYVARLERGSWAKNEIHIETSPIHPEKTYLITGGLGGLGLSLAKWMVQRGARHLVLLGRNAPNATAEQAIREMQSAGASIHALRADVTQRADVDAVLAHIAGHTPPLRGIVHAAAVLADRTLSEMTDAEFFRAVEPKVFGAWNLHEATRQNELDFFVVYSSVAGILGSPGQANYAAANTFLDALCHARKAQGLAGTSIQWGPFADVGMAATNDIRGKRLAARGNTSFSPEDGNQLFERVLVRAPSEVALMHFDVRQWVQFYPQMAGARLLVDLMRDTDKANTAQGPRFRDELEHVQPHERSSKLTKHVLEALGQILRVDPTKIDKNTPFTNLGMDSLMSLELRNRFEATLGIKLSPALLFTYSTTAVLAKYLLEKINGDALTDKTRTEEPTNDVAPAVEVPLIATPDDDADDLLALFDASAAKIRRENLK